MSNYQCDIWLEQTTEELQATGKYDCRMHETSYADCEECIECMAALSADIDEEKDKLE